MKCIPDGALRIVSRTILQGQKHSPKILFVTGIVGVVATTVVACRATLKLEEVLEKTQKDLDAVKKLKHQRYSEQDREQDTAYLYIRGAVKIAKLYLPAIGLGVFSIGCLVGAHGILSKRNIGLTAAYAAIDQSFKEYRSRVVGELGEDKDREFRYGVRSEEVTVIDESGKKTKEVVKRVEFGRASGYARFFDEYSRHWCRDADYNSVFIQCQQNYANDLLRSRGHVFLNEVYDLLGFERTTAGSVVGWIRNGTGDGYIDFGIFDNRNPRARDFVNGREYSVLLDFNVDGVIYDKI